MQGQLFCNMQVICVSFLILSTYNANEIISYITTADVAAIQHVKGIGAKTAQRIIIDLKN